MTLKLGPWQFKLRWLPTLALVVLMSPLLWLGLWQLDRATAKESLWADFQTRMDQPPVTLPEIDTSSADSTRYRRFSTTGYYANEKQLLLDNQLQNGRVGYHVYTPLIAADGDQAILVNRGWVPVGNDRRKLPVLSVDDAIRTVQGRVDRPATPGIKLAMTDSLKRWPIVVQHIDFELLSEQLRITLIPRVVLLDNDQPDGYRRDWRLDFGTMTANRHRGYAVQWFGLAITLLIFYLVLNSRWQR